MRFAIGQSVIIKTPGRWRDAIGEVVDMDLSPAVYTVSVLIDDDLTPATVVKFRPNELRTVCH